MNNLQGGLARAVMLMAVSVIAIALFIIASGVVAGAFGLAFFNASHLVWTGLTLAWFALVLCYAVALLVRLNAKSIDGRPYYVRQIQDDFQ